MARSRTIVAWVSYLAALASALPGAAVARPSESEARTLLRVTTESWYSGDRVRVTSPGPYRVESSGWFHSQPSDSTLRIRFDRSDAAVEIGLSRIGAVAGALAGAAIGAAVRTDRWRVVARFD